MRSRNRLHKTKLADFRVWLEARGWKDEPTKDFYEVLRMSWPGEAPLLVHRKNELKEHYTTWGISETLMGQWLREKKPDA